MTPPVAATWSADCQAVLLDLDGTLVDSTEAIFRAWRAWAGTVGVPVGRLAEVVFGRSAADVISDLAPRIPRHEIAGHVRQVLALQEVDPAPATLMAGADRLTSALRGRPWAVVTGCSARLAQVRLAAAGLPVPPVLVADEDIPAGKPDPAGYLLALHRLGVPASQAVAVEDAPSGVRAARAARVRVIGVATTHPPAALAEADAVATGLRDLGIAPDPEGTRLVVRANVAGPDGHRRAAVA